MRQVSDQIRLVSQREEEINALARSIADLAQLFRDMSVLVIDQVSRGCWVGSRPHALPMFTPEPVPPCSNTRERWWTGSTTTSSRRSS